MKACRNRRYSHLLLGQALELGRVTGGEGEDLVDVHADHVLGVEAALHRGDDRAGVVAVRAVAVVAEPPHQLGPRLRGALRVPARLGGRPGEAEPRKGRDDHVERVGRVPAVGARVGERTDEAEVLHRPCWASRG